MNELPEEGNVRFDDAQFILVFTTVANEQDACQLAEFVVAHRLAACVQIDQPVQSYYHWKGQVQRESEYRLAIKTTQDRFPDLHEAILGQHPYELPEVIALPILAGHTAYLKWIAEEVRS